MALAPTRDGRLFLSGKRNLRTRIRALEIIQNVGPRLPSLGKAVVADSFGDFNVEVSSLRQRFLEAFRMCSEHAASIDDEARAAVAARLIVEYGEARGASDAQWAFARQNGWIREDEAAERFQNRNPSLAMPTNHAAVDLVMAWHSVPLGTLHHDGPIFRGRALPSSLQALPIDLDT